MRAGISRSVVRALGVAALFFARPAAADPADDLFHRGKDLIARRNYAEACPLLAESVKKDPGIGATLWLGECYEKNSETAKAWAAFRSAASLAAEKHDEREKVATRRALALESRLPRIIIAIPHDSVTPGLEIKQDGILLPANELDATRATDAGVHTISASAPGRLGWSVSVTVPEHDAVTVNVPRLEDAPPPPVASVAPAPIPLTIVQTKPFAVPRERNSPMKIAAIAVGALGVGALGGGAFLGFQAKATYDASNKGGHCVNNACDAVGKDGRSDAHSLATLSTVAFAGAGAAIAASIVMFVIAPSTTLAPAVGKGEAGLSLTRGF